MNAQTPLIDLIKLKLEKGEVELPVFDDVARRVYEAAQQESIDAEKICSLLQEDPILVSEVLRLANSSFFSGLAEINTLQDAVIRLGLKQLSALVMSISQKRMYSASGNLFKERMVALWQHVSVASLSARWIANHSGCRKIADQAHVAALLHDVGKLSLLRIIEDLAVSENIAFNDLLIDSTLDKLYCEHGADLLEIWGLPSVFCEIVRHQDDTEFDQTNVMLSIVRLADKACAKEGVSDQPDTEIFLDELPEAACLGIDEVSLAELCIEIEDMRALS